jgi:uncharacterized lipoprotein YajG
MSNHESKAYQRTATSRLVQGQSVPIPAAQPYRVLLQNVVQSLRGQGYAVTYDKGLGRIKASK